MALPKFQLTTPLTVGDLSNPVTITTLAVTAISFQFDPSLTGATTPQMIVSIVLKDPISDWSYNVMYKGNTDGAAVLTWFNTNFATILVTAILNKLIADGKLPAGKLV